MKMLLNNKIKSLKKISFIIAGITTLFLFIGFHNRSEIRKNFKNLETPLQIGDLSELRLIFIKNYKQISYKSDNLNIVADFYENKPNSHAIVLLHGSSVKGRKLALNQILSQLFFENGNTVLAIDLRGYGESDDPPRLSKVEDFNFANDVVNGIDFILENTQIDTNKIFLIGHSFGGGVSLAAINIDKRIKKAVIFGPPRRYGERFFGNDIDDRNYLLSWKKKDMELNYDLPFEVYSEVIKKQDIENNISKFNESHHIPLFFIDCEKEDIRDLNYLQHISKKISFPVNYWTVPKADHYLNTQEFFGLPVYNKTVLENFTNTIQIWLDRKNN